MGFSLLINSVEYNCNLVRETLEIRESLQANGASLTTTIQLSGALTVPRGGQHVQFYRDSTLEFAGRIQSVDHNRPHNANQYTIHCADYTVDFDSELILDELAAQVAGDQVRRVVGLVGRGFTSNNVATGPLVGLQELDYELPSSVVSRIAESIEHQWYIDYERDLHFFYILDRDAPVTSIDFDTNVTDYADFTYSEDASQVKNVIYLTGAQVKSEYRDTIGWAGDGASTFFALNYEPWSLNTITVRVDGVPQELRLDGEQSQAGDGGSETGVVYVCLDNWGIRWPDNSPPGEEAAIDASYNYAYEPVVIVENLESIAYMKALENVAGAPSNGRHVLKFAIPDLRVDDEETIVDYGNLLLLRYAFPVITGSFDSRTQGWKVGQNFRGTSVVRDIDQQFYVTGVSKRIWQSSGGVSKFVYSIDISSTPFPG